MDFRAFLKTKTFAVVAAALAVALIVLVAFVVSWQIERPSEEQPKTPDNVFSVEESDLG